MKKIGLVGGISWTSTIDYYRIIHEESNKKLGGMQFPELLIYSVNFESFRRSNAAHDWEASFQLLSGAAHCLKKAGAEMIVLCANTAHIVASRVRDSVGLPLIDIRDAVAADIKEKGLTEVGLLGTLYTMDLEFYRKRLAGYGINTLVPESKGDREFIEETLSFELGKGIIKQETKEAYIHIAGKLIAKGAQGIILGCTEIPLLISQNDFSVPVFNSTYLHACAAVDYALSLNQPTHV